MRPLAAIVLAAGASRRLGQPKQLLLRHGETLIGRAIRLATEAGAAPVIAVLGAHSDRIFRAVAFDKTIPVVNDQWEQGIAGSIHAGLNALDAAAPAASSALILGCDQPLLTVAHLRTLIEGFSAQTVPPIVASSYAGVLGIPAIFPRFVFTELLDLRGDTGARAVLMQPNRPVVAIPLQGGEVDIDLPADIERLE
jgi:CTP:molybdopterin cytidylyltransferase MocA